MGLAIVPHERGIPSKRESSARVDYVPALCTHRPSLLPIVPVNERLGLVPWPASRPALACREDVQIIRNRGSKSRNKVSVGEPADGSLPKRLFYICVPARVYKLQNRPQTNPFERMNTAGVERRVSTRAPTVRRETDQPPPHVIHYALRPFQHDGQRGSPCLPPSSAETALTRGVKESQNNDHWAAIAPAHSLPRTTWRRDESLAVVVSYLLGPGTIHLASPTLERKSSSLSLAGGRQVRNRNGRDKPPELRSKRKTTLCGGSLGSPVDEERSQLRELM